MSCCDQNGLMSLDEAFDKLINDCLPTKKTQTAHLSSALGKILAEPIISTLDVPPWNNSAVDGYAIHTDDIDEGQSNTLSVSQRIPAGAAPQSFNRGTAARIFTGAPIPDGANAVLMQEDCTEQGEAVTFIKPVQEQANIRPQGQDIAKGQTLFQAGHRLRPQDLGLVASVGVEKVKIFSPLKVAILSTGDELAEPGEELRPGQIYNSNRYLLLGLLNQIGLEILDLGIVPDNQQATREALIQAADNADIILTTGGVSVGEEDHIKATIEELGSLNLWRLAIKPGKPLAYGYVKETPVIGLPGNPGAVFVTFCIIARSYLLKKQGAGQFRYPTQRVRLGFSVKKPGKRRDFQRVRLNYIDGLPVLEEYPNQSSGVLSSASWASGLAVIMENTAPKAGELIDYISFNDVFSCYV